MSSGFKSGAPMFACDADMRIVLWNDAAELLTGIPASQAVGQRCWQILSGRDDYGSLVCHRGCSQARLARHGWPVSPHVLHVKTPRGTRRIGFDIVSAFEGSFLMLHLMRALEQEPGNEVEADDGRPPVFLTKRQQLVLRLLASGLRAQEISEHLGLSMPTVRNHIHAILVQLGAHSQLEAVVAARKRGMIPS